MIEWGELTTDDIVEFIGNSWYDFWDVEEIVNMLEEYFDIDPETGRIYILQWLDHTYSYMRWGCESTNENKMSKFLIDKINTLIDRYLRSRDKSRKIYQKHQPGSVMHIHHSVNAGVSGLIAEELELLLLEANALYPDEANK